MTIQTDSLPVVFEEDTLSFDTDNGATEEDVMAYLAAISRYTVIKDGEEEGTSYSVSENHGTPGTPLLTEEGTIDLEAVNSDGEALYEEGVTYSIEFTVTGYVAYTITFTA